MCHRPLPLWQHLIQGVSLKVLGSQGRCSIVKCWVRDCPISLQENKGPRDTGQERRQLMRVTDGRDPQLQPTLITKFLLGPP